MTNLKTLDNLYVDYAPNLVSLHGLEAVTSLQSLTLSRTGLTSLHELSNLHSEQSMSIGANASLPDCEVTWLSARTGAYNSTTDPNGEAGVCAP